MKSTLARLGRKARRTAVELIEEIAWVWSPKQRSSSHELEMRLVLLELQDKMSGLVDAAALLARVGKQQRIEIGNGLISVGNVDIELDAARVAIEVDGGCVKIRATIRKKQ